MDWEMLLLSILSQMHSTESIVYVSLKRFYSYINHFSKSECIFLYDRLILSQDVQQWLIKLIHLIVNEKKIYCRNLALSFYWFLTAKANEKFNYSFKTFYHWDDSSTRRAKILMQFLWTCMNFVDLNITFILK